MKLIFLKGKKSNNPTPPDEPTYTLNVLPPTLTASTLMELGQDIPIDTNLSNEPPTIVVTTAVAAQ